ncbi:MAG: DEAD/DEAH box helicase, partial [Acetobacteraceae bacterium]|nr:DEAD/DEAH box helicase [Acetobacteraceae bacterium]
MQFPLGSRVIARGLLWDVLEATPAGAQQRLRLRCAAGDLRDLEWEILHPAEPVALEHTALDPEAPGPLAAWRLQHIAFLLEQVLGPDALLASQPGRINIEPYQLVPLLRALELPRPRLLLADGVGLGKTIEACLIITELIIRRRAHRVLIVAPAGPLLTQWEHELRQRFGLRFTAITDSASLQQERRRHELGGNPFDAVALCLTSLDFAKQERVLEELERSSWDLAIIDEAHHCVGGAADTDDTLRRRLAEVVARRSDGLLLLTATPHDGNDAHFASLMELLDPSLVDGRGALAGNAYRRHVVRRLKNHLRDPATGTPLFRERRVIPVRVDASGPQFAPAREFHHALSALVAPRLRRGVRTQEEADALAFVSLLKRSVSTISACVGTLRIVAERYARTGEEETQTIRRERARALRAYRRRLLRFGMLEADAAADAAALEIESMAAELQRSGTGAALQALIAIGESAAAHDPKLDALLTQVRLIRSAHPAANILIYTEYADSQLAALQMLRTAPGICGEVLAISGLDPEAARVAAAERFATQEGVILISTDTLAEGLNLHQRCWHLIHLDLPYNPNRLEQRNGRIDRYGQAKDPEIRYLYLVGTFEERLLLRLIARYEKARSILTFMPDTLGVTADDADWGVGLVAGFAEQQESLFNDDTPVIRTLDAAAEEENTEAYRDLLYEIDRAFESFEHMAVRHGWMAAQGLNADTRQLVKAAKARRPGGAASGAGDLLEIVAAAVAADGGSADLNAGLLRLPANWTAALEDLPGFDKAAGTIRITRDQLRMRSESGELLTFLGRAHPLVRRAISRVRHGWQTCRVSAAWADPGMPPALLMTFAMEIRSARQVELQHLIAVLLPRSGEPRAITDVSKWLRWTEPARAMPCDGVWRSHFHSWATKARQDRAAALAQEAMERM